MREQTGNHPGQHVAHAAAGHARIAERAKGHLLRGIGDQAAGTLEHDHGRMAAGQFTHRGKSIGLDLCHRACKQTRGLAGVRRQHGLGWQIDRFQSEKIETIGIEHAGPAGTHGGIPERVPPGRLPQARANGEDAAAFDQGLQCLRAFDATHHQFRPMCIDRRNIQRLRRHTDQAGTDPQGGLRSQRNRAGHAFAATDRKNMTIFTFIYIATALLQQGGEASVEQLRRLIGQAKSNVALLIQRDDAGIFVPVELG